MITTEEDILREYHGNKPFSLGGAWRVYKAAPKIPRSRIDKALQKSEIYTKYKQPKKQKFFSPIYVRGFRHIWQADLAVFRHKDLKAANYPFQYMLIVIDCWTRRIWLEPMVSKECEETIEKFDKVFKSVKVLPLMIQTDQGGEFKCKLADRYFDNKKIFTYWSRTKRKCAFVERVIQTIKNIYEKKMERNNNKQKQQKHCTRFVCCRSLGIRATCHYYVASSYGPTTASRATYTGIAWGLMDDGWMGR